MKYIIEKVRQHLMVYVVEADNEEDALKITEIADENYQEYLGDTNIQIQEYSQDKVNEFSSKDYFWDGVSFKTKDGYLAYEYLDSSYVNVTDTLVE